MTDEEVSRSVKVGERFSAQIWKDTFAHEPLQKFDEMLMENIKNIMHRRQKKLICVRWYIPLLCLYMHTCVCCHHEIGVHNLSVHFVQWRDSEWSTAQNVKFTSSCKVKQQPSVEWKWEFWRKLAQTILGAAELPEVHASIGALHHFWCDWSKWAFIEFDWFIKYF